MQLNLLTISVFYAPYIVMLHMGFCKAILMYIVVYFPGRHIILWISLWKTLWITHMEPWSTLPAAA